jgi:hypothetical protein
MTLVDSGYIGDASAYAAGCRGDSASQNCRQTLTSGMPLASAGTGEQAQVSRAFRSGCEVVAAGRSKDNDRKKQRRVSENTHCVHKYSSPMVRVA